jgi:SAM-dependent methyltransferase
MNPRETIRSLITKNGLGIEICPAHKPVAPKKEGYRCLSLDRRSREEILAQMKALYGQHPDLNQTLEEVDLKGSPGNILDLVLSGGYSPERFDYIVSPHNFEHLPNPVDFFVQCRKVLKPEGQLFITMPDRRACFDYFRPFSTLAELLSAYFEKRTRPTQSQIFEHRSLNARFMRANEELTSFPLGTPPEEITPMEMLKDAFSDWKAWEESPDPLYRDAHCWTFTPASLELILDDLRFLGILDFDIIEIRQAGQDMNEIYARLMRPAGDPKDSVPPAIFYRKRSDLLRRMHREDLLLR